VSCDWVLWGLGDRLAVGVCNHVDKVQIDALFHYSGFHAIEIVGPELSNAIVKMIKNFIAEIKNKSDFNS